MGATPVDIPVDVLLLILATWGAIADSRYRSKEGRKPSKRDRFLFVIAAILLLATLAALGLLANRLAFESGFFGLACFDAAVLLFALWELGRWRVRRNNPLSTVVSPGMSMSIADKVFFVSSLTVAGSTAGLWLVTGYGTWFLQLVVFGAYALIARLSSNMFAEHHHGTWLAVTFLLNMVSFSVVGVPLWMVARKHFPKSGTLLLICWTAFYVSMLFILFPATDGP